jgi:UDP-N-acetylmuramoyl-tripeptide--D-alanyl-D-alanine ligase
MRFESGALSSILGAEEVRAAAEPFVRVLVRVPEAYLLVRDHAASRPGLLVLDADGRRVDAIGLGGKLGIPALADWLREAVKAPARERIRLRVARADRAACSRTVAGIEGVREVEETDEGLTLSVDAGALPPAKIEALGSGVEFVEPMPVSLRVGTEVTAAIPGIWYSAGKRFFVTRQLLDSRLFDLDAREFRFDAISRAPSGLIALVSPMSVEGVLAVFPDLDAERVLVVARREEAPWEEVARAFEKAGARLRTDGGRKLRRAILDESLEAGTRFLLANQKREGHFTYLYDFVAKREIAGLSPVRQAGALWSLALIHQARPTEETADAVRRGLSFFLEHSRVTKDGRRYVVYPGSKAGRTGTVALVSLALVDLLRAERSLEDRPAYEKRLEELLAFLWSLRTEAGLFHQGYRHEGGDPAGAPSPYFDGETLLALCRASAYLGYGDELRSSVLESAEEMYRVHVVEAREVDPDSNSTKGFYQWGSMSFFEIHRAGWDGSDRWAERTVELARWMIDVHRTLARRKNTAYAHEGMLCAWELARRTGDLASRRKIGRVIDEGLMKLTTWQVGGPAPNEYLESKPTTDPLAVGGVMNAKNDPVLRIDVTQHQMHAVILARRFVYRR